MSSKNEEISTGNDVSAEIEEEITFGPGADGMGIVTAMETIDRKLRKELINDYDLVELVNRGRYYTAKAYSKDGLWLNELLVDKQSGNIQVLKKTRAG